MAKSKRTRDKETKVASWLCDAYGIEGDEVGDFKPDARDLIQFMAANGWSFYPNAVIQTTEQSMMESK